VKAIAEWPKTRQVESLSIAGYLEGDVEVAPTPQWYSEAMAAGSSAPSLVSEPMGARFLLWKMVYIDQPNAVDYGIAVARMRCTK
jgi:hypothetical protein